jgi:hypothetical protein
MTQDSPTQATEFGRFKLLAHRRELLADGQPVELGARAFDVLVALVEAHGDGGGKARVVHLRKNTAITGVTFDSDGGQQLVEG